MTLLEAYVAAQIEKYMGWKNAAVTIDNGKVRATHPDGGLLFHIDTYPCYREIYGRCKLLPKEVWEAVKNNQIPTLD